LEKLVHVFYTSCGFQDLLGNPNNQGIYQGFTNLRSNLENLAKNSMIIINVFCKIGGIPNKKSNKKLS
jgi:hypothetical protein